MPLAPLSYWADFSERPPSYCLRADPVQWLPDLAAVWMQPSHIQLQGAMAKAMQACCVDHGLRLVFATPQRGYLLSPDPPQSQFITPWEARGQSLEAILPVGTDQQRWRSLLTELQVVAHQCNQRWGLSNELEARADQAGGLWLHSGGWGTAVPAVSQSLSVRLHSEDGQLLAKAFGLRIRQDGPSSALAIWEWAAPANSSAAQAVTELGQVLQWCWRRLRWGHLRHFKLITPQRCWQWRTRDLWWRSS